MSRHRRPGWLARRKLLIGIGAAVVIAVGGIGIGAHLAAAHPSPAAAHPRPGYAGKLQNPVADATPAPTGKKLSATRVQIPSIHVDTRLIALDLKPGTNQLKAPLDFNVAGWYVNGTIPGEVGPAVIDGHVDSPAAPGVFLHLARVKVGDRILVTLSDHQVKTFVVTRKVAAPKTHFPTQEVYGPTPTPQLRVITCDGFFNTATGHYLDNLVVFASLQT